MDFSSHFKPNNLTNEHSLSLYVITVNGGIITSTISMFLRIKVELFIATLIKVADEINFQSSQIYYCVVLQDTEELIECHDEFYYTYVFYVDTIFQLGVH